MGDSKVLGVRARRTLFLLTAQRQVKAQHVGILMTVKSCLPVPFGKHALSVDAE